MQYRIRLQERESFGSHSEAQEIFDILVHHSRSDISHARFKEALEGAEFFSFNGRWVCFWEKGSAGYKTAGEKIWYIPKLLDEGTLKMSQRDRKAVVYDRRYAILFEYDKSVSKKKLRHTA